VEFNTLIEFKEIPEGFEIYYKNRLLIKHTKDRPFLKVGKGTSRIKSKYGHFKIKDKVSSKIAMNDYQVIEESNKLMNVILGNTDETSDTLELTFREKQDYLEITPKSSNLDINRFWISFVSEEEEGIYGIGEQFSELNMQGKKVPLWVEENGVIRGSPKILRFLMNLFVGIGGNWYTTYFPQPTFVSSNNYFVHMDTTNFSRFNFKHQTTHELYNWRIPNTIIIGKYDEPLTTISKLSELLGRQPELPDWCYDGAWLGIQGGIDVVEAKIKRCLDKKVKFNGIWCQDWCGERMTLTGKRVFWDWIYDEKLYPNLPSYIESLNDRGIKFLGYINSFLATDGILYEEASKNGYCIKNLEGNDYLIKGNGIAAILDLTNPEAVEWLKKEVIKKNMIDIGLSGWMADFGEYLPTDAVLYSGEDPQDFHNKYPVFWAKANYDAINESRKLGEIVFFTRSGYSNVSKYTTMMWAGDQLVSWNKDSGFPSVIIAALSLGICGIGFHHSDVGGYSTFAWYKRKKEFFMRWAEHCAFTMLMRTHEGNMPNKNIQFDEDEELLEHFARMTRIHVELKPYLRQLSKEYIEKGYPPMRAMFLHYNDDPNVHQIKYQYLLGRDLIVSPVLKKNCKEWGVYLPDDDEWINIWTGAEYKKGWQKVESDLGYIPVFYLKDSEFSDLFKKLKDF
jgi:alpha-glucosidase